MFVKPLFHVYTVLIPYGSPYQGWIRFKILGINVTGYEIGYNNIPRVIPQVGSGEGGV